MFSLIRPKILALPLQRASVAIQKAPISTSVPKLAGHGPNEEVGPYPRTKEEFEQAAKKYNLIPEDYKPLPEEEGYGDYPDLPAVGAYNRDWYDDFDDPQLSRDYAEPYHIMVDKYYWERHDPLEHEKPQLATRIQVLTVLVTIAFFPFFYWFFGKTNIGINHPWKKRNHHSPNQKYYQFPVSASSSSHH